MTLKNLRFVCLLLIFAGFALNAYAQVLDPSFHPTVGSIQPKTASLTLRADGKSVYFGSFRSIAGVRRDAIAVFNQDGTIDPTFDAGEVTPNFIGTMAIGMVVSQPDNKLLVSGPITKINNTPVGRIARLNLDGSVDASFNLGQGFDNSVYRFSLLPDGKILAAGSFRNFNNQPVPPLIRLNSDGSLDTTFNGVINGLSVDNFVVQPDGKIIAVGDIFSIGSGQFSGIVRLNANGSIDNSFNPGSGSNNYIYTMLLQPDGKLLISGNFNTYNGVTRRAMARVNADGSLDSTFNAEVRTSGGIYTYVSLRRQSSGQIIIGGGFDYVNDIPWKGTARLNTNGSLDQTFAPVFGGDGSEVSGSPIYVFPDDKVLVGGGFTSVNQVAREGMALLNADGSTNVSYNITVRDMGFIYALSAQPDGKIIAGGSFGQINGLRQNGITRLHADGAVDVSFNIGAGFSNPQTPNSYVRAIAVQPDGKIIAGGSFTRYNDTPRASFARINGDGSLDNSFTGAPNVGIISAIVIQPDNKILVAGSTGIVRMNADGTKDTGFTASTGSGSVSGIALQPDGRIIIGGAFTTVNGTPRSRVARLNTDGTIDASFNSGSGPNNAVLSVALQADGKIILGGAFVTINGTNRNFIARLNADGALDASFNPGTGANGRVDVVQVQPDGKVLVGGAFTAYNDMNRSKLARILENGALDTNFAGGLEFFTPTSTGAYLGSLLQTAGGLIVGGNYTRVNNKNYTSLSKLKISTIRAPFDFDGDSKTDIGIFRPSDGSWWYSRSIDSSFRVYSFGTSTDLITPGDFTGDGKADIAVFRPTTGEWFVQRSDDNSFFSFPFGAAGDMPVPSDYDGDGKTDPAVFRPSTATWFILNSNGSGTSIVNFGTAEDKPVPADFDGDGKADIAIFRPGDGSWWYLRSSDSQFRVFRFGLGTDKPVQGDYTGDGKADIAVFRPETGEWFFQRSEDNSYYSVPFGAVGDIATPGDYDGDGRFDTAVFRPSSADWFVQRSTAGILITNFGANGDRPIPNAFVP